MDSVLTLYGYLVLTLLAILVPLFGILLSIFREGISALSIQYQNEKLSSEKNLSEQWEKHKEAGQVDVSEVKKIINELEINKKKSETKLSFLNPRKQIARLFILYLFSFIAIIPVLVLANKIIQGVSLAGSLISFSGAICISWKLMGIVVEVKTNLDDKKKGTETKIIELLTIISQQKQGDFLKKVYLRMAGSVVRDDKTVLDLVVNNLKALTMSFINGELRMARKIEVGVQLPHDFIIEKSPNYSIFTDKDGSQIVRYKIDELHANTNILLSDLRVKPINAGEYLIETWIKAENIETTTTRILFRVISV